MFVFGLPRSRTAWLSVFLSQSGVRFHHEALDGCRTIKEYSDKIKYCGDCTTGFYLLENSDILEDKKIVVITKSNDELKRCISWCDSEYGIDSADIINAWNEKLNRIGGLKIKQSEIDENLEKIWRYLTDKPWDNVYTDIVKMNIQVKSTDMDLEAAKSLYESIQQDL